jgi:hypothetical protein
VIPGTGGKRRCRSAAQDAPCDTSTVGAQIIPICELLTARSRKQSRRQNGTGFQGAETLLTECDLGEAAGRFIDGGQNNRIPADLTQVAAAARACTPGR